MSVKLKLKYKLINMNQLITEKYGELKNHS